MHTVLKTPRTISGATSLPQRAPATTSVLQVMMNVTVLVRGTPPPRLNLALKNKANLMQEWPVYLTK